MQPCRSDAAVLPVLSGAAFSGWHALNDRIMGGSSSGACRVGPGGLDFDGEVIEAGGGFISCRSPLLSPPLNLEAHEGLELEISGEGRCFKLAVGCADGVAGLTELIPGGLRWVHAFDTAASGVTNVRLPFSSLRPSLRAQPLGLPLVRFDAARITRLQLLHSRFGDDGRPNAGFRPGRIHFTLHAIRAYP